MAETLQPTGIVIPNADGKEAISPVGVAELRATGVTTNAAIRAAALTQGTMPLNADLDSWVDDSWNGLWHAPAATAATVTGVPAGTGGQPFQLLQLGSRARVTTQLYIPYGFYTTGLMSRSIDNVTTRTWTEWAPLGAAGLDPMTQHAIRQAQMIHAIGPVDTGGLGAVAFRFDHGFTNFRDKVLPEVKARGIKVAQAYNARNWHYAENTGVTATDLNGWVATGDVEIMNHSADHLPAETRAALHTEIVTGLAEIETELPAARGKVWGFAPPGVSSGDWMGFNDGRTPAGWDTYAGQLILKHHAVGTGYLAGTSRRVLDGKLRDGLGHVTIDGQTVAQVKAAIDEVIASRMGLQLMLHPSQLDTAGKLTTAQFVEVLDYVVTKRDAGELAVLSPYQMMVADSTNVAAPVPAWADLTGKPAEFPPSPHTHAIGDVTGLAARLATLEQDTGWRIASLDTGVTGRILVRRTAGWVTIRFENVLPPAGSGSVFLTILPSGFTHTSEQYFLADGRSAVQPSQIGLYNGTRVAWMQIMGGSTTRPTDPLSGEYSWRPVDAFPATVTLPNA